MCCIGFGTGTGSLVRTSILPYSIVEMDKVVEPENKRPSTKPVRQKWTSEEEKKLKILFSTSFKNFKCPNTKEIKCAVELSEKNKWLGHLRKLENIKKKVSNMIIKMKQECKSMKSL